MIARFTTFKKKLLTMRIQMIAQAKKKNSAFNFVLAIVNENWLKRSIKLSRRLKKTIMASVITVALRLASAV